MKQKENFTCPNCNSNEVKIFYTIENIPVHSCVLLNSKEKAENFQKGNINLGFCENCGFIYNTTFIQELLDYTKSYEDQQCFSHRFNIFMKKLIKNLMERYDIYNKNILEIGCGKGDFLLSLCELGNNHGVGIDPAIDIERIGGQIANIKFIKDYYSKKYLDYSGEFVCCRHTLEHIHKTFNFLSLVRESIKNMETIIFFEVPDITRVLKQAAFWDIYYEHCSYFSPTSLSRLFRLCYFEILNLYRAFDNQYLLIEAKPANKISESIHPIEESISYIKKKVNNFSTNTSKKIEEWTYLFKKWKEEDRKIAIWGSGSKCVGFISNLKIEKQIKYIVDINPYRNGKYLPGIAKKIVSPKALIKNNPDITIIMNPVYKKEIKKILNNMSVKTKIMFLE
jgi:ubiquinone/menaquinone biosynthesis C-methylase UbiE